MTTVAHLADHTDVTTSTSAFLDSAAHFERQFRELEERYHRQARELRHAQQYQARALKWIVALRRSHRGVSHARTSRLFRQVLTDLAVFASMPQIGKE